MFGENSFVDWLVVLLVCYFYDIVSLVKNYLQWYCFFILVVVEIWCIFLWDFFDFLVEKLVGICYVIEVYSFSVKIVFIMLEVKIVQDVDRLEVLGVIGLVWVFVVFGVLGVVLFDVDDFFVNRWFFNDK